MDKELEKAAKEYCGDGPEWQPDRGLFIAGAKWQFEHPTGGQLFYVLQKGADLGRKNAIDKACEWLKHRGCLYIKYTEAGTGFDDEQFIKDFRKAMED